VTAEMTRTSPPSRMTARDWGLLLVVCGALFLEGVDIAMLNVAVPEIRADLHLSPASAQWVISAYVLGYGGFMLLGGRSADIFGRRRVFLVALGVFVAFSGIGGLAHEGWVLVLARFVTGVAAGFMTPAGLSIVTTSFPQGPMRDRAVVVYGAVGAAGFSLGMVAGGLLTSVSWRLVFFAPVVLGAVLLVVGRALIRQDPPTTHTGRFDVTGAVTITAAMIATVYGLVTLGEDMADGQGLAALALATVLLASFVAIERRTASPLLRLGLLRDGTVLSASTAGLLFMAAFFGFQLVGTLYLQELRGWSPVETGLTFAIMGIDLVLAPLLTPALVARFGNGWVMVVGFVSATAAFGLLLRLEADATYFDLLPSLLLVGVAFALAYGPLTLAATDGVVDAEHGAAGGVLYTAFQFGAALGVAGVTIALSGDGGLVTDHFRRAFAIPMVLSLLAAVVMSVALLRRRIAPHRGSAAV
jgi:MFS family permease